MFKREKRMHSFIIRAQEILAEGKREESAKMVIQGLQHYSNKIIGAIQPYSKADATLLVEDVEKVKKATEGLGE